MQKKKLFVVCLILSLLIPTYIFAWGSATHAYYANHLGTRWGYLNVQEMYGAMVPDMFNTMFGSPYYDYLWLQTHEQFGKVLSHANTKDLIAFALGYASHNDLWGADYTAHHDGCTTGEGYVYARIDELAPTFAVAIKQILLDNGIDPAQAEYLAAQLAPSVAHDAIEAAIDILIKRNEDPGIGARILAAAQFRSPAIPGLLVAAYAADFAQEFGLSLEHASGIVVSAEQGFQEFMSYYGFMFTRPELRTIQLLSIYGADLAKQFIYTFTGLDISVPPEAMANLLVVTIDHVEATYADEVAATLAYLENELPSHGIESQSQPIALRGNEEIQNINNLMPQKFSLAQNSPNPFNPTTTINYSLVNDSQVKLTVYNTLGQVVAVMVDGFQPKGSHSVKWDAHNQPSGFYIYRLEAEGFTATKKMFLQK